METTRGKLLAAAPSLSDPNFRQSVLFVLEHNSEGALGVVLNRPSELAVASAIEGLGPGREQAPGGVRGRARQPVVGDRAGVGRSRRRGRDLGPRSSAVSARSTWSASPPKWADSTRLRIFAGYAAWAPGQLEAELAEDAWFVLDFHPSDPFSSDPNELWWQVFDRQESELRRLRFYPRNPSDN